MKKQIENLQRIQNYFGVGTMRCSSFLSHVFNLWLKSAGNEKCKVCYWSVRNSKDLLNVIIPHFDQYPLQTCKGADYLLFKQATFLFPAAFQSEIGNMGMKTWSLLILNYVEKEKTSGQQWATAFG